MTFFLCMRARFSVDCLRGALISVGLLFLSILAGAPLLGQNSAVNGPLVVGLDKALMMREAGEPVRRLSLERERLRTIPSQVFEIAELEELVLDRNKLTSLDGEWARLPDLVFLRANNNSITAIPDALLNLPNLEVLELGNNELQRIPLDIDGLRRLRELVLSSNPIGHYPASLGNMRSLERLDLMHNVMTAEEITAVQLWVRPEVELILPAACGCDIEENQGDQGAQGD